MRLLVLCTLVFLFSGLFAGEPAEISSEGEQNISNDAEQPVSGHEDTTSPVILTPENQYAGWWDLSLWRIGWGLYVHKNGSNFGVQGFDFLDFSIGSKVGVGTKLFSIGDSWFPLYVYIPAHLGKVKVLTSPYSDTVYKFYNSSVLTSIGGSLWGTDRNYLHASARLNFLTISLSPSAMNDCLTNLVLGVYPHSTLYLEAGGYYFSGLKDSLNESNDPFWTAYIGLGISQGKTSPLFIRK